jgi:hypothetical protein
MGLNEVEAAQALGELAAERRRSGLPSLSEPAASWYLRTLAEVRHLPESAGGRVPAARRSGGLRALLVASLTGHRLT